MTLGLDENKQRQKGAKGTEAIVFCKENFVKFCKENFNIKLVFNSFTIKNYLSYKDPTPIALKSFLVYKFTCANCSSSSVGEICCHFKTRIEEHLKKDIKPQPALTHIISLFKNN